MLADTCIIGQSGGHGSQGCSAATAGTLPITSMIAARNAAIADNPGSGWPPAAKMALGPERRKAQRNAIKVGPAARGLFAVALAVVAQRAGDLQGWPMGSSPDTNPAGASPCCGADVGFDGASPAYRRMLSVVIALNVLGFAVLAAGAVREGSTALSANALDFIADAATYALSLWAIGKPVRVRSGAAFVKATSLLVVGIAIVGYAVWRAVSHAPLHGEVISGLGLFGGGVNVVAAILLARFRDGDANVRSVWLCTRNDLIESIAVVAAGGLVIMTGERWPDLVAGFILAAIFLHSAWSIISQARTELRAAGT